MTGLPPIVMQTAGDDPISVDADKIEAAVAATGTGILDHRRFANLWHDFHLQVSVLDEAREAVADLGAKLRNHLSTEGAQISGEILPVGDVAAAAPKSLSRKRTSQ